MGKARKIDHQSRTAPATVAGERDGVHATEDLIFKALREGCLHRYDPEVRKSRPAYSFFNNRRVDGKDQTMTEKSSALLHKASQLSMSETLSIIAALSFGIFLVLATNFSHMTTAHNAAHDTRHSIGFPCH